MSQVPAGWLNDPYGRYQQRYWDGSDWTGHVMTNGERTVDPLGKSPVIPFATPSTAFELESEQPEPEPWQRFLDALGPDARERPRPSLGRAVAGLGGAVLGIGVLIAASGDDPGRGTLIGVSVALVAVAWALRWFVKVEEVAAASVGMVLIGLSVFSAAATVNNARADLLTGLLMGALFLVAWAGPGFRGRNLLLGLGALALLGGVGSLADGGSDLDGGNIVPTVFTQSLGTQGTVYLVGAALFFAATWWLDRRGYPGMGTALVGSGLVASIVGTVLLVDRFGDTSGPTFVSLVGLVVCVVGSHGGRRATTWWGAALLTTGVVSLVAVQVEPNSSATAGGVGIGSGVLLVALSMAVAIIRRSAQH